MLANFTRPEGEKPRYYSSTVENGVVVQHEGDLEHAVYESEMDEISRRANLWHKWLDDNVDNAHNSIGAVNDDVYAKYSEVRRQFMEGERSE